MVSRIADEGDYKYGKLNTIGWLKNGVEEVASRRALLMVCGHDEKLKTKYACLNVLSTAEMYNIYFGWEFRDKGGNGRSVLLSLNSYIDSQLDRTMVFPRSALLPLTLLSLPSQPENLRQSNFPTLTPPLNTLFDLGPDTLIPSPRPLIKLLCAQHGSP